MRGRLLAWAGPVTIGSFAVVALTGILLFFHLGTGCVKAVHELSSFLLVAAVIAHSIVNWKPFVAYFRKPLARTVICALFALGVASPFLATGSSRQGHGPPTFLAIARALEQSSLETVAEVAKCSPQSLIAKLAAQGIKVRDQAQTIQEIAQGSNRRSFEVLGQILRDGGSRPR